MAGQLFAVGNSKIFIGSRTNPKGTVTEADFAGEAWIEIGEWTSAGSIGDTVNLVEQDVISSARTRKAKGTRNAGTMENTFIPDPTDPGQIRFKRAIDDCKPYKFKIEWAAGCLPSGVITADGDDFTSINHTMTAGQSVTFSNDGGALPAGITAGATYYVLATGLTEDTFQISATRGGPAIATTTAGTGVSSFEAGSAVGQTDMFFGLAMPGARQGGEANTAQLRTWSIAVDSNIVEV